MHNPTTQTYQHKISALRYMIHSLKTIPLNTKNYNEELQTGANMAIKMIRNKRHPETTKTKHKTTSNGQYSHSQEKKPTTNELVQQTQTKNSTKDQQ